MSNILLQFLLTFSFFSFIGSYFTNKSCWVEGRGMIFLLRSGLLGGNRNFPFTANNLLRPAVIESNGREVLIPFFSRLLGNAMEECWSWWFFRAFPATLLPVVVGSLFLVIHIFDKLSLILPSSWHSCTASPIPSFRSLGSHRVEGFASKYTRSSIVHRLLETCKQLKRKFFISPSRDKLNAPYFVSPLCTSTSEAPITNCNYGFTKRGEFIQRHSIILTPEFSEDKTCKIPVKWVLW